MRPVLALAALATFAAPAAAADECLARSAPTTATLVELYTSEGCSSCPPADRWLSALAREADPARVVPVAFHVDYWDYIGWKDAYAQPRFTARQRHFAAIAGAHVIYTPQVVVDGRDFRGWRDASRFGAAVEAAARRPAKAAIEARGRAAGSAIEAEVSATLAEGVRRGDLALFAVLTQGGIATRVTAGENRGETLRHDAVARSLASGGFGPEGRARLEVRFPAPAGAKAGALGLVAFVQDQRTGEVLQALSAPLCG